MITLPSYFLNRNMNFQHAYTNSYNHITLHVSILVSNWSRY